MLFCLVLLSWHFLKPLALLDKAFQGVSKTFSQLTKADPSFKGSLFTSQAGPLFPKEPADETVEVADSPATGRLRSWMGDVPPVVCGLGHLLFVVAPFPFGKETHIFGKASLKHAMCVIFSRSQSLLLP